MVLLLGQQTRSRNQVSKSQPTTHVNRGTGQAGQTALHEVGATRPKVFDKERLALGLGIEVVPQRLHQPADQVVQIVRARQAASTRQQHQHAQRIQGAALARRPFRRSGLSGRRHAGEHFDIGHGILLEGEQDGPNRPASPLRFVSLVVDALGLCNGLFCELGRVAQPLLHRRAVRGNEGAAPVELFSR